MLNVIWLAMIIISVVFGVIDNRLDAVVLAVTDSAKFAVTLALGLTGIMVFWLGLLRVAEKAGLITLFAKGLRPIMVKLFPDVPADHPAMGAMVMNIAANMLGIGNAATPFGLHAMEELAKLSKVKDTATDAMCTFLAINTSSVQLIPTTAIAMLAASGAAHPTDIIVTSLCATTCSTIAGIAAVKLLARTRRYAIPATAKEI